MNWKKFLACVVIGLTLGWACMSAYGAMTQSITGEPNAYWWTSNIYEDDAWTWAKEVETIIEDATLESGYLTLTNGLIIDNETDTALTITEDNGSADEDLVLTFTADTITATSSTGLVALDWGTIVPAANQMLFTPVATPVGTTEGTLYYDSDVDILYVRKTSGWVDCTASAASGSLDAAYNTGSTIDVDTAALTFTVSTTDNNAVMVLAQNDASQATDPNGLEIDMVATSNGTAIDIDGNSTGYDIKGTGDLFTLDGAGALVAVSGVIPTLTVDTLLDAGAGITLDSGDKITNAVDTEILFLDTGGEDFILDLAAASNAVGLKSGTGVDELAFGAVDDLSGIGTVAFDAAAATVTLTSTGDAQDLTIAVAGSNNVTLALTSTGTSNDAMTLATSAGGMDFTVAGAADGEDMDLLSNRAINLTSTEATTTSVAVQTSGGIDVDAVDDIILTLASTATADDFLIQQTGAQNASILLQAAGTGVDAIGLAASAGGITMTVPSAKTIAIGATAGSYITMGNSTADWDVLTDNASFTLTDTTDDAFQLINSSTAVLLDIDLGATDGIDFGDASCIMALVSADWNIDATGAVTNLASIGFDANSSPTITAAGNGADTFTISQTGNTDNNLVIDAQGTAADALTLSSTTNGGGITVVSASGAIEFSDDNLTSVGDITCDDILMDSNTEIMVAHRTIIKTINADSDDDNCDFECDDTAADQAEQNIDLGAIIPAYAEIVSIQVRCYETVTGSAQMSIDVGTSSGGAEIIAAGTPDTANDILSTAAAGSPEVVATNAARNVWVNMTPNANWNTPLNEGKWAVMVTYLDYGAVYTQDSPP